MEEWRSIDGYPNYEVSNFGRVRSFARSEIHFLKPCYDGKKNYLHVKLSADGRRISRNVHRLVAEAFVENPFNYPCINHKDEDKTNNMADNLEWCTVSYNNTYGSRHGRKISAEHIEAMREGRRKNGYKRKPMSEETKNKISHALIGKKFSEEHIANIKKSRKDVSGPNNPMYGRKQSEETKRKISEKNKGRKRVICG